MMATLTPIKNSFIIERLQNLIYTYFFIQFVGRYERSTTISHIGIVELYFVQVNLEGLCKKFNKIFMMKNL